MKKAVLVLALLLLIPMFLAAEIKGLSTELEIKKALDAGIMLRDDKSSAEYLKQTESLIREQAEKTNFTSGKSTASSDFTYDGGSKYFLGINLEFISFTLRSVGEDVEVWVADDLGYGYDYPYTPDRVTQEQVDKLRDEFEANISPTVTGFFGNEEYHDGTNSMLEAMGYLPEGYYENGGKKVILVENIKDESYYGDVPFYVAGFYWYALEYYHDLNIVTLDSYAWWAMMPNDNPRWEPYQYQVFGTLAHEFQHLIHDDNDPLEENWINEGMADFSQYLCGYGHNWDHISWFLAYPENSLLLWGDYEGTEILADYGQAYLLQLYLSEQFGREFIRALATDPYQGIESVNRILNLFDTGIDFHELFLRFSIAVAIDTNTIGNGIYQFDSLDIGVDFESAMESDKEGLQAWGAEYKVLDITDKIDTIRFQANEFLPMKWQQLPGCFYSGSGDGLDHTLILEADLRQVTEASLEFDHQYLIEDGWDYGFVQVSEDGGFTWTSLANENTRSYFENWGEYPEIGNQLPGFTGSSSWTHEVMDLSAYAGKKVLISFRYMTDGAYSDPGWIIDNLAIPEINYHNDCSSMAGFKNLDQIMQNYLKFTAVFINKKITASGKPKYNIVTAEKFNSTEENALQLRQLLKDGTNYMIMWYDCESNDLSAQPFTYKIITK